MPPKTHEPSGLSEASTGQSMDVESEDSPARSQIGGLGQSIDGQLHIALEENRRLQLALQTVRHSAGNQLALLSAMLARQARVSGDPSIQQALKSAQRRVHTIAETLRIDGAGEDGEFVNAKPLIERLAEGLSDLTANAEVKIELDISEDIALQRDQAISFMLIINELVVNSLKHAFPQNMTGEIRIRFSQVSNAAGHFLALEVEDNGIGRVRDDATAGLGTTVILAAVQSLHAKLVEDRRFADDGRRGIKTVVLKPHPPTLKS